MAIPAFFYEATRYIERELRGSANTYDISHVDHEESAKKLLVEYRTDPDLIRKSNVSTVIAALKIQCKEEGKNALFTNQDVSNLFGMMFETSGKPREDKDWQGVAEKILEKKPLVVLLLRHFHRVFADKLEFPVKESTPAGSWPIAEYLIIRDATNHNEEREKKVVTLLIGKIQSLERKRIPPFIVDFIDYVEGNMKTIKAEDVYCRLDEEYGTRKAKITGEKIPMVFRDDAKQVKREYETKGPSSLEGKLPAVVSSGLQLFIEKRKIIKSTMVEALVNIKQNDKNKTDNVPDVRKVLHEIPFFELNILIYFIKHLNRVGRGESNEFLAKCTSTCLGDVPDKIKKGRVWISAVKDFIDDPDLYF